MPLPEFLTDPVPLALLTLAIFALIQYQRTLSWTEYRAIHRAKVRFLPILDKMWPHAVHVKRYRENDEEYLTTRDKSVKAVWKRLVGHSFSPHVINSLKQRQTPEGEVQLSAAHVVWFHDDGGQTECYLFDNGDGTADAYAHFEPSVQDPEEHLNGQQVNGDPRGVVRDALGIER